MQQAIIFVLLLAASSALGQVQEQKYSRKLPDSCIQDNVHLIGYPDSLRWATCQVSLELFRNQANPEDGLYQLFKSSMGMQAIALHSQNKQKAYWLNFWFGASGEINYIYQQNREGLYQRIYTEEGWYSAKATPINQDGFHQILLTERYSDVNGNRKMILLSLDSLSSVDTIRTWAKKSD